MTFPIIGDLAQSVMQRRIAARAQIDLSRAGTEISTQRIADAPSRLGAAMNDYSAIERRLTTITAGLNVAREVLFEAEAGQAALGMLASTAERLSAALLGPATLAGPAALALVVKDATHALEAMTTALNARVGDRSLFAGTSVDAPAIATADEILDLVEAEVILAGAATSADLIAVVDAFFAPGGGFETSAYLGSTASRSSIELTANQRSGPMPRADDAELRDALKSTTLAALLSRNPVSLSYDARVEVAKAAGVGLLGSGGAIASVRAAVGLTEERASLAQTELATEDAALRKSRFDLIGVDPFEAATDLAEAEARLERIYTITARLSRLSLTDFLR